MAGAQGAVDLARTLREHGPPQEPAAAGPGMDRVARTRGSAIGDDLLAAHRRRDQCEDRHRDRRRLDPCRTTGEAAPAEDREASRVGDTRGHGRGAGRRGGVRADGSVTLAGTHARARRGRDPGNTPAGDRGCQPRRPRRRPRHRADAGPRRRGRRSRTPARGPGPPQGRRAGPRRSRRPVGRAGARGCWRASPSGRRRGPRRPRHRDAAGRRRPTGRPSNSTPARSRSRCAAAPATGRLGAVDDASSVERRGRAGGRERRSARRHPDRAALAGVLRHRRHDRDPRSAHEGDARRESSTRGRSCRWSVTTSASSSARTPARCSGSSATRRSCSRSRRSSSSA